MLQRQRRESWSVVVVVAVVDETSKVLRVGKKSVGGFGEERERERMVERGTGKAYVVVCNFSNSLDFGGMGMGMGVGVGVEMAVDKDMDMDMDTATENENRMGCDCQRR